MNGFCRAKMHAYIRFGRRLFMVMLPFSRNVLLFGVTWFRACLLEREETYGIYALLEPAPVLRHD